MLRVGLIAATYLGTLDGIADVRLQAVCDVERAPAPARGIALNHQSCIARWSVANTFIDTWNEFASSRVYSW
jgi:hypothetical protein